MTNGIDNASLCKEPLDEDCSVGTDTSPVAPDIAAARAAAIARAVVQTEELSLIEASGRVLSSDVHCLLDIPPFDNSAMDGYALRSNDLDGDGPWTLAIAGRSAAGDHPSHQPLPPLSAMRILTGAPMPVGFDAVVMQEHCIVDGQSISFARRPSGHRNVRLAGEDVMRGQSLLRRGDLLTPQKLALLAGAGHGAVHVFRRVRIGLISTGSELREPGEPLQPGQIYNSNRILLRTMLSDLAFAEVIDFGIVPDNRPMLEKVLHDAANQCDAIVSTGGVSGGDEDHVAAILREGGAKLDVVKVAMRPGKPVKIGLVGNAFFAGLPGNPNAALVTFRRIALPALRALAGLRDIEPDWRPVIAGFSHPKRPDRTEFVPVKKTGETRNGVPVVEMLARGSSASLSAMALADGIALLPPENESIQPGMTLLFEKF
jgi:molybdopterin molybdotransferase